MPKQASWHLDICFTWSFQTRKERSALRSERLVKYERINIYACTKIVNITFRADINIFFFNDIIKPE